MDYIMQLDKMEMQAVIDIIKIYFISLCSYYMNFKIMNVSRPINWKEKLEIVLIMIIITIVCKFIREWSDFLYLVISMIIFMAVLFCLKSKIKLGESLIVTIFSLTINYIIFITATGLSLLTALVFSIQSDYINLIVILTIYLILFLGFLRIKRIKNGFSFLQTKLKNEYLDILILNISCVILFSVVLLSNYEVIKGRTLGTGLIILAIMMFVTIQKSLELYYKQRMLVKDLEETKKELEDKKAEVKELEKENLNFSKISHTIAHRQKSLEHKLEELNMNNEISNELGARIEDVTKDLKKETAVELSKTGIEVIDDMLSYMQSECIKNKIDFQLQINGNIYTMTNHYIGKDELEILLADHIKNAIIAIGYADSVNKSILVRLGKIDGNYGLYIYDSGIEFEIDTLMNLGIKPSTTHKDNGGTGMGFMNTFDTLRKYKASLEIEEIGKPCKDNFTKVLKFKFDNKEEFTIKSYRKDEIKKKDKENKLNLI